MVGSALNSATTAHLLPLCVACDLDGALLVRADAQWFAGGFDWQADAIALTQAPGIGCAVTNDAPLQ
jgi:hypothetical protein